MSIMRLINGVVDDKKTSAIDEGVAGVAATPTEGSRRRRNTRAWQEPAWCTSVSTRIAYHTVTRTCVKNSGLSLSIRTTASKQASVISPRARSLQMSSGLATRTSKRLCDHDHCVFCCRPWPHQRQQQLEKTNRFHRKRSTLEFCKTSIRKERQEKEAKPDLCSARCLRTNPGHPPPTNPEGP
ncbi:hypothetical protein SELMODRAFT_438260 [Selaginella moellendorffii]|uniref:Uncharacterized protein n=1 Tax=Selaginella moellendorffii TaxID=88036 RepID=D8QVE5_SELML|nr:hypothetical protein SELMODRAFT_438260 [Selaginella moellendorffii]